MKIELFHISDTLHSNPCIKSFGDWNYSKQTVPLTNISQGSNKLLLAEIFHGIIHYCTTSAKKRKKQVRANEQTGKKDIWVFAPVIMSMDIKWRNLWLIIRLDEQISLLQGKTVP